MDNPMNVRLHLGSGTAIDVLTDWDEDAESDDAAAAIEALIDSRPAWVRLGSTLFFTGAVSAIEVEELSNPEGSTT